MSDPRWRQPPLPLPQVGAIGSSDSSSGSKADALSLTGAEFDALSPSQQQEAGASLAVFSRWGWVENEAG